MDVTIKLSDGTEQVYHIFISSISVDKKQHTKIICRNRRGSGLMKPLLSYLTNNPDVKPVHILITSENDVLLKDVLMLLGGMDLINKGITPPAAKWYGKVGTVVFYLSVFSIIFLKAAFQFENFALDVSLLSVTAITMLFALYQYGKIYFQLIREHNSKEKSKENAESK